MLIQWFPGHMTKALRMIDDNVKLVDGFIYVLDARAPYSSLNPEFLKRMNNKPFLYVLNKADLANDAITTMWRNYFTQKGVPSMCLNSTKTNASRQVYQEILKMMKEKIDRNKAKGVSKSVRIMVLGIPNCGKSTLINNFCGKKRAMTGDRPGVTKGKQWLTVDDKIELLDTPGTLYPSFENQEIARNVAYIGSINDDILDIEELAVELIKKLLEIRPTVFSERFEIDVKSMSTADICESICQKRGYILKGGELDYPRFASAFVDEFRKGKLGLITLETPQNSYVGV